jgi:dihydrofolate reductase
VVGRPPHGVPVFVLTHAIPGDPSPGSVRYVTDVPECDSQARAVAGDGDVMVHGAGAAQALLRAGQLEEMKLHVVPVLLGQRRRLFDDLPPDHVELELLRQLSRTPRIRGQHITTCVTADTVRNPGAAPGQSAAAADCSHVS